MNPLHHVGYWVDDLDEAMARAIRDLGVGPFLVHRHVTFAAFTLADGTEIDDPVYFDHSAAFVSWGSIVLEFDQVHTADPHIAEAYKIGTSSVGHVSWIVDDLDAEVERLEAAGCALIHTAAVGDAVRVAWHDGGPLFPHPIEVHRAGPPILGMARQLAALADAWDGAEPVGGHLGDGLSVA